MRDFYRFTANFRTETEEHLHRFFEGDTMVLEQNMKGLSSVRCSASPARAGASPFGVLHVFGFGNGLISREQFWIDSGSIVAQLTTH